MYIHTVGRKTVNKELPALNEKLQEKSKRYQTFNERWINSAPLSPHKRMMYFLLFLLSTLRNLLRKFGT